MAEATVKQQARTSLEQTVRTEDLTPCPTRTGDSSGSAAAPAVTPTVLAIGRAPPAAGAIASAVRGTGRLARLITAPFHALRQIIYPPLCLVCDADLEDSGAAFCSGCLGEMIDGDVPTCMRCAATVGPYTNTSDGCLQCRRLAHRFDAAVRLGVYAGKLREQCLAFKSSSNELLGRAIGRLMVDRRGDASGRP